MVRERAVEDIATYRCMRIITWGRLVAQAGARHHHHTESPVHVGPRAGQGKRWPGRLPIEGRSAALIIHSPLATGNLVILDADRHPQFAGQGDVGECRDAVLIDDGLLADRGHAYRLLQQAAVEQERTGGLEAVGRLVPYVLDRSEEHTSELQSRQYLVCR